MRVDLIHLGNKPGLHRISSLELLFLPPGRGEPDPMGAESQRDMGGEAEDGIGSLHASVEKNHRVVQA